MATTTTTTTTPIPTNTISYNIFITDNSVQLVKNITAGVDAKYT